MKKYQINYNIQMFKPKSPNGIKAQEKKMPPRPKPQFTTDFVDRQKYKLSQTQMIQKKAALQSKHRQQAIQQLQERRKKLQQGIIDDDTRKVYETALTSKKIDINPPVRKNLSQMIKYEREKQDQLSNSREKPRRTRQDYYNGNQEDEQSEDENVQVEKQLRDTRDFIKKFQRAKKMDNIERAVELLSDPIEHQPVRRNQIKSRQKQKSVDKTPKRNPLHNEKILADLKPAETSVLSSQEQALSCIEDTIKFMEDRLFSTKRIEKIKQEEADKLRQSSISMPQEDPFILNKQYDKEQLQLSGLGHHEDDSEEQCLQTIRRMKDMMEGKDKPSPFKLKENCYDIGNQSPKFEGFSSFQKTTPNAHIADSQAEVDFSLTINDSDPPSMRPSREQVEAEDMEYERIKKSLFEQVNRLQLHTPEPSIDQPSFQAKSSLPIDQSSIPNMRNTPTPVQKSKKVNNELAMLKNQIGSMQEIVEGIKVEPMNIVRPGEVMGMDFRGSINIKKHIIQK